MNERSSIAIFPSQVNASQTRASGGAYLGRLSRFEMRSQLRWGNWSILEFPVPTPFLWLDPEPVVCLDDTFGFVWPAVVELWP